MSEKPTFLVSVVVPCFNSGATISRTIASIRSQTHANIETIIVNDDSTDSDTKRVLLALEKQGCRILNHDLNLGLPAARNSGFAASKGDFVLFLDSDDWIEPQTVEKMLDAIPFGHKKFFIYCDLTFEGERQGNSIREYRPFSQLVINRLPYCILVPKLFIDSNELYCEAFRSGLEDWDLNLSLIEANFLPVRVNEPLFHYNVSRRGMFASSTGKQYFSIWRFIRARHPSLYSLNNLVKMFHLERLIYGSKVLILPVLLLGISLFPSDRLLNFTFQISHKIRNRYKGWS